MTIDNLLVRGILEEIPTSKDEIQDLLNIVDRDLKDSDVREVSHDWQFGIAYNAALKLAGILVRGSGYRVKGGSHHMNTIAMIPLVLGEDKTDDSDYLDACRKKRNTVEYDCVGGATEADVKELREFVKEFREVVVSWAKDKNLLIGSILNDV
jgi:hypothetical protein